MAFLTIVHIIAALVLIILVLVQDSKGAMGESFGGGGGGGTSSILGPTGTPNFLFKLTRYIVIVFALTSLFLSKITSESDESALDRVEQTMPIETGAPEAVLPIDTEATPSEN